MTDAVEEKKSGSALEEAGTSQDDADTAEESASSRSSSPEMFATIAEKNEKNLIETLVRV